ncbi:branched-chain-amino-acid transaminase [Flavobacteriaceae bacterium UJ101]|nr:branched-chain-amino-acid transaminase [Flavobacteriaceae bacterium UJ101]
MSVTIQKAEKSKLEGISFDDLVFGKNFTDHMLIAEYKDGKWSDPVIKPYGNISISPAAQALHYGQAVFEGMKAYRNENNEVFLFRPEDNFIRINKSCKRLNMPELPKETFIEGLNALVDLDRNWIPTSEGTSLYLRPFVFASEAMLKATTSMEYTFMILCSPARSYYSEPLKVKIADHYSRAASGGVGYAKAAGNYAASFFPTEEARKEGFDQVLWTDAATHSFIEESGTMNVFVRYENKLVTAPTTETILNGVTRRSVIEIGKELGLEVEERPVSVEEVVTGIKSGEIKEMFGCGTAVVLIPYKAVGYKDEELKLNLPSDDESIALKIKNRLVGIQTGVQEDPFGWRVKV